MRSLGLENLHAFQSTPTVASNSTLHCVFLILSGETKIQSEETDKVDSRTKQTEEDNSELIELKKERYREQLEHDRVRDELQAEIDTLNITVQNQEAAILGIKNCYQAQLHSAYVHVRLCEELSYNSNVLFPVQKVVKEFI